MKFTSWHIQALGLLFLVLLSLIVIPYFAERIPVTLQQHISNKLQKHELDWVSVTAEGRNILLAGEAPNIESKHAALDVANRNNNIANIKNEMTPRLIQPYTMKLHWDSDVLSIDGYVPDKHSYEQFIIASKKLFGDNKIQGDLRIGAGSPEKWNDLLITSITALSKLQQGSIDITDKALYIAGKTPYLVVRKDINTQLSSFHLIKTTSHIVATDESKIICQNKFNTLLASNSIRFTASQSTINRNSYPLLRDLASVCTLCPNAHITIEGHTDNLGTDDANQQLSQKRAQATVAYLFQQGIPLERLTAIGLGEQKPIANNKTELGRSRNRRIEFIVKP